MSNDQQVETGLITVELLSHPFQWAKKVDGVGYKHKTATFDLLISEITRHWCAYVLQQLPNDLHMCTWLTQIN